MRLEAHVSGPVETANAELVVGGPAGGVERYAPLPRPGGDPDRVQLAFPVPQATVEAPEASFELELESGAALPLPRPALLRVAEPAQPAPKASLPPEPESDPYADAAAEIATLHRALDRLRQELRDTRIRLDEEERRADELYRGQLTADERSAAARAASAAAVGRSAELESELAGLESALAETRDELQAERERSASALEEAAAARQAAEARAAELGDQADTLTAALVAAREEAESARSEGEEWHARFDELAQEAAHLQAKLEAAASARDDPPES